MKENKKKKWIVDERHELKRLEHTKLVWTITLILLGVSVWVQSFLLQRELTYYLPETVILLVGCVLQIVLGIKDGVQYTKEAANRKFVWSLYIGTPVVCGIVVGISAHLKYDAAWYSCVLSGVILAVFMFGAIMALDFVSVAATRRRIARQEQELDRDED